MTTTYNVYTVANI